MYDIIADALKGYNLQVNSRAGAGKTTLLIAVAKAVNKRCVILTYNRALCDEANERLDGTPNCHCFTIHALFGKQTGTSCNTDIDLLYEGEVTRFEADIVLIDEAQDLRPTLYDAIMRMAPTAQYILCGTSTLPCCLTERNHGRKCPQAWRARGSGSFCPS